MLETKRQKPPKWGIYRCRSRSRGRFRCWGGVGKGKNGRRSRHSRFASPEAFRRARWRKPPCESCAYIFCNLCTSCTPGIFRSPAMICSRCLRSEMSSTISTLAWLFAVCAPMLRMLL